VRFFFFFFFFFTLLPSLTPHPAHGLTDLVTMNLAISRYVSLHRKTRDFYPRTGEVTDVGHGAGKGFTLNVPWRRTGMGNREYQRAFEQVVMPVAAQWQPQLVLVSAGFDASHGDPLGDMQLTPSAYGYMVMIS
jgi:acetoin utilization deacetylase AcuC-like enzyme